MTLRVLILPAVICCLAACDSPVLCTMTSEPAIEVRVRDVVSGLPAADGAIGYVRDGDYVDSLRTSASNGQGVPISLRAADERPGVYTVVVIKNGYETWRQDNVRVGQDECHVRTVQLDARLVQASE